MAKTKTPQNLKLFPEKGLEEMRHALVRLALCCHYGVALLLRRGAGGRRRTACVSAACWRLGLPGGRELTHCVRRARRILGRNV